MTKFETLNEPIRFPWKIYLGLLLITLVGYWPVTTGLFSVKNDDIIYFLPYRYNVTELIINGHFPLWSPYVFMGSPIAGDMQSGVWNPFVWLFALTGRYTLSTLHWELLVYIYLGGTGMYKLMQAAGFERVVGFTIAVCYMFSGFITDSGQILCWVSCAGSLPFVYLYFFRLLKQPTRSTGIKLAFANLFLFVAAGYPFFFIANTYFLCIAFVIFLLQTRKSTNNFPILTCKYLALSAILFLITSTAPVLAFVELMPFYLRGHELPLKKALDNSYSLLSLISLYFPFAATRNHSFFNDNFVISRSVYIGILVLPFAFTGILTKRTYWWNIILLFTLLSLAMSLARDLPVRSFTYRVLPLMDNFRHPSNFRLFVIIGLLAFAGKGLQQVLSPGRDYDLKFAGRVYIIVILFSLVAVFVFLPLREVLPAKLFKPTPEGLKALLDGISFRQGVLISFLIQAPFLTGGALLLRRRNYRWFCGLAVLNVLAIAQVQLFCGTVAKNPVFRFNQYIKDQPHGFPIPDLSVPVNFPDENQSFLYEYKEPLQYFFNKKMAINTLANNPTILTAYNNFVADSLLLNEIRKLPFIFSADRISAVQPKNPDEKNGFYQTWLRKTPVLQDTSSVAAVSITAYQPLKFRLNINSLSPLHLVILQNNLSGWHARVGNIPVPIKTVNKTFMGLELPAGKYDIEVEYRPGWFLQGVAVSALGFLIALMLYCFPSAREKNPSARQSISPG